MAHRKPNSRQEPRSSTLSKALFAKSQNVKVYVRFRPINSLEKSKDSKAVRDPGIRFESKDTITVPAIASNSGTFIKKHFTFDGVLPPQTTQEEAFHAIAQHTCDDILEGYNGTIFVYGQTGSGKTHTMYGPEKAKDDIKESELESARSPSVRSKRGSTATDLARDRARSRQQTIHAVRLEDDPEHMGIIPMSVGYIFSALNDKSNEKFLDMKGYTVTASFLEIYNDKLYDLIDTSRCPELRFDTKKQMDVVRGISEVNVMNLEKMLKLITKATGNRTTSATDMNATSSRSHLILRLKVTIIKNDGTKVEGIGNFADLAGSERQRKTHAKGDRFTEAKNINKSLSVLQNVIKALSSQRKHVPYKECELTRVLQDSLGGNCKTTLLVAASPHIFNRSETVSSLYFGEQCKKIRTKAILNLEMTPKQLRSQIEQLQKENEMLRNSKSQIPNTIIKKDLEKQVSINQNLEEKLKTIEKTVNAKDEELVSINAQKAELETELQSKREEVERLEQSSQQLLKQIESLTGEILAQSDENASLVSANTSFQKEIAQLQSSLTAASHAKEQLEISHKQQLREQEASQRKITSLESHLSELESLQNSKITQILNEKHSESKAAHDAISQLEQKYAKITESLKEEVSKTDAKLSQLSASYSSLESTHSALQLAYNKLTLENESLRAENASLRAQVQALQAELTEMQSKYSKLESDHSDLQQAHETLQERYEALQAALEETRHQLQLKTSAHDDLRARYDTELDEEQARRRQVEKQNLELKQQQLEQQEEVVQKQEVQAKTRAAHERQLTEQKLEVNKLSQQLQYVEQLYKQAREQQIEQDRSVAEKLSLELKIEATLEELRRKHPGMPDDLLREAARKTAENVFVQQGQKRKTRLSRRSAKGLKGMQGVQEMPHVGEAESGSEGGYDELEGDLVTKGAELEVMQRVEEDRKQREEREESESLRARMNEYEDRMAQKQRKRQEKLKRRKEKEEAKKRNKMEQERKLKDKERKLREKKMQTERRLEDLERQKMQQEQEKERMKYQEYERQQRRMHQQKVLRANARGVKFVGMTDDESSSDDPVRLG